MGAVGPLAGQRQHLRAEGGQHPADRRRRPEGGVGRLVHGVQVGAHGRQRLVVVVAPQVFDEGVVAHPETEQDPLGKRLGEALDRAGHRHGVPGPDAGDARRADQSLGRGQQQRQVDHDVAPGHLGQPDGAVAELLELGRELLGLSGGHHVEGAGPDSEGGEGHEPIHPRGIAGRQIDPHAGFSFALGSPYAVKSFFTVLPQLGSGSPSADTEAGRAQASAEFRQDSWRSQTQTILLSSLTCLSITQLRTSSFRNQAQLLGQRLILGPNGNKVGRGARLLPYKRL